VDLVVLSRDLAPLREDVVESILGQRGVSVRLLRATGPRAAGDRDVLDAIVRGRNAGKRLGDSPLVMFVDDDVVLGPDCVRVLAEELSRRPEMAALGADSAGEMRGGWEHWDTSVHVGMAAVLFRRERLEGIRFRWEPGKCECRCCCEDLRRAGHGIGYCPGAAAWHRPAGRAGGTGWKEPVVLAAFDRTHVRLFISRFLGSLRREGNPERVIAVVSGLRRSEQEMVARRPGVEVVAVPHDGHPARRRLRNFAVVLAGLDGDTPVAYWDAGDVRFQGRIARLWGLVRSMPDRLLAATEVIAFRESVTFRSWVETIADPVSRAHALRMFANEQTINSGFAAGTAEVMRRYCDEADALLHSPALAGTGDWGDQTAMNLYCRTHPECWREVSREWNYCLVGLGREEIKVDQEGRIERVDGGPVVAVHGAGRTLSAWDRVHEELDASWGMRRIAGGN
jgi:hypothetical protein